MKNATTYLFQERLYARREELRHGEERDEHYDASMTRVQEDDDDDNDKRWKMPMPNLFSVPKFGSRWDRQTKEGEVFFCVAVISKNDVMLFVKPGTLALANMAQKFSQGLSRKKLTPVTPVSRCHHPNHHSFHSTTIFSQSLLRYTRHTMMFSTRISTTRYYVVSL